VGFIGVGFIGVALLDRYHAVIASVWIKGNSASNLSALIPWSWAASRLVLSTSFQLCDLAWRREQRLGDAGGLSEKTIYMISGLLISLVFLIFAVAPLPVAYLNDVPIQRPAELSSALLFLLTLIGFFFARVAGELTLLNFG